MSIPLPKRSVTAGAIGVAALAAGAAIAFSPSPATGSSQVHLSWHGKAVGSLAEAKRLGHAGAPNTLTLTDMGVAQSQVDVGDPGGSPGDFMFINLRLFNESAQKVVGRAVVRCEAAISTENCQGTLRVYKRGQIEIEGIFYHTTTQPVLAVTGGTGEFRGVGGVVNVFDVPQQPEVLVVHLR